MDNGITYPKKRQEKKLSQSGISDAFKNMNDMVHIQIQTSKNFFRKAIISNAISSPTKKIKTGECLKDIRPCYYQFKPY
ncbi:hypothetical protein [Paenibacillus alvei]|nr:hypothetical protein [Paenibacillus alvei]MBG9735096.1 hypothetical protein [Paenibacillus alvei]MBG9743554.1 hypothetical protein [Paenibacillus alvei]MCY9579944.1 hypothetical protein [Paenibacillus alvei]